MNIKTITTPEELKHIMPLVDKFFAKVKPDYSTKDFWKWTTQPQNYIVALYDDTYIPIAYIAICYQPSMGRDYLFLFHSYVEPHQDGKPLWKYVLKISKDLKLPLLTNSNRPERAILKYGWKKDSTLYTLNQEG